MTDQAVNTPNGTPPIQIKVVRIYTKDLSLEVPLSFDSLMHDLNNSDSAVSFDPNLNFRSSYLSEKFYETSAHLKLTVKTEKTTLYLLEVQLVGIFSLQIPKDVEKAALEQLTQAVLFPYLSELVNDLSSRTSFPSINLVNLLGVFEMREDAMDKNISKTEENSQ